MSPRQRIFVSYHHGVDEAHRDVFVAAAGDMVVGCSEGDAALDGEGNAEESRRRLRDQLLRESIVTVVLIGARTWQRRHVDWEIGCSLRNGQFGERSGLLGVLLPSYPPPVDAPYHHYTLPPRLADNVVGLAPFARVYAWPPAPVEVEGWVRSAYHRRTQAPPPNNDRPYFFHNRAGERWWT